MATTSNESDTPADTPQRNAGNEENDGKDDQSNMFECNICLESAKDAVVSVCGHLFWLVPLLNENYSDKYIFVNLNVFVYCYLCI